jgi:hypothetical protein
MTGALAAIVWSTAHHAAELTQGRHHSLAGQGSGSGRRITQVNRGGRPVG